MTPLHNHVGKTWRCLKLSFMFLSLKISVPNWLDSVVEHRPMKLEVTVEFPVRAHTQVASSIPGGVCRR